MQGIGVRRTEDNNGIGEHCREMFDETSLHTGKRQAIYEVNQKPNLLKCLQMAITES